MKERIAELDEHDVTRVWAIASARCPRPKSPADLFGFIAGAIVDYVGVCTAIEDGVEATPPGGGRLRITTEDRGATWKVLVQSD